MYSTKVILNGNMITIEQEYTLFINIKYPIQFSKYGNIKYLLLFYVTFHNILIIIYYSWWNFIGFYLFKLTLDKCDSLLLVFI